MLILLAFQGHYSFTSYLHWKGFKIVYIIRTWMLDVLLVVCLLINMHHCHYSWSLIAVWCNLCGWKGTTWWYKWRCECSWCEAIVWMAFGQIAISSKINTCKEFINWFARKSIWSSSCCGCLQHLLAKKT